MDTYLRNQLTAHAHLIVILLHAHTYIYTRVDKAMHAHEHITRLARGKL